MIQRISEKGSMTLLFATFVVPLFLLLAGAVHDIQNYSMRSEEIQGIADEAALYGSHFLPDGTSATDAARSFVFNRLPAVAVSANATADEVTLRLSDTFHPFFAPFFNIFLEKDLILPLEVASSARNVPLDLFVALDRGQNISPPLSAAEKDALGDEARWGVASLFQTDLTHVLQSLSINPRIATQQCFNPVFNFEKLFTVRLVDALSKFSLHRVGVDFFPGAWGPFGVTKIFDESLYDVASPSSFYDTHIDRDEDDLVTVEEVENLPILSLYCAAIAESEPFYGDYRLPPAPAYIGDYSGGQTLIDRPTWKINPAYPISAREKIWSRASIPNGSMDYSIVLSTLTSTLYQSGSLQKRGGLKNDAKKVGIVLSNRLPVIDGASYEDAPDIVEEKIHSALEKIGKFSGASREGISLYLIYFGDSNASTERFLNFIESERNEFLDRQVSPIFISAKNIDEVLTAVLTSITLETKAHAVSQ